MNEFVYVVSLIGKNVLHNWSIQYVITRMDDLDKVRAKIKKCYNVKFEEVSYQFEYGYWKFDNITDNRDIHLIVEQVEVLK